MTYYMTSPEGEKFAGYWDITEVDEPRRLRLPRRVRRRGPPRPTPTCRSAQNDYTFSRVERRHPGHVHEHLTTPPRPCRRCSTWASRRAPPSAINQIDGFLAEQHPERLRENACRTRSCTSRSSAANPQALRAFFGELFDWEFDTSSPVARRGLGCRPVRVRRPGHDRRRHRHPGRRGRWARARAQGLVLRRGRRRRGGPHRRPSTSAAPGSWGRRPPPRGSSSATSPTPRATSWESRAAPSPQRHRWCAAARCCRAPPAGAAPGCCRRRGCSGRRGGAPGCRPRRPPARSGRRPRS